MRQFNTLTGFLDSKSLNISTSDTVELQGFSTIGDGYSSKFQHNGVTGQTPSQSPVDLGLAIPTLNDADGNQWVLISGAEQEFNATLFYPSPFGDSGKGMYAFLDSSWVKLSDTTFISPITTTELINSSAAFLSDANITTTGFTASGDGGSGSWIQNGVTGQTPSQSPAQLGDALLNDANGNQWVIVGDTVNVQAFGGVIDGSTDNTLVTAAIVEWGNKVLFPVGIYITTSFVLTNKRIEIEGAGEGLTVIKMLNNAVQNVFSLSGTGFLKASNLTIDQNFDNNSGGHGIRSGGCDGLILDYVTIQNCATYGIGFQGGTAKGVSLSNFTIKNTNSDGIDIKDYNFDNECIFITNYSAINVSIIQSDDVALDIRGEVCVNGMTVQTVTASRGVRTRVVSAQGRAGFGVVNNVSFTGHGSGGTIALHLEADEGNMAFNNIATKNCDQSVLQSLSSVGGIISNLTATGIHGDGMSIGGSDLIINGYTGKNTVGSSRLCDVEVSAINFSLRNFHVEETTASIQAIRVQAGAVETNFSSGTIRGGSIGDSGTGTVQDNIRLL